MILMVAYMGIFLGLALISAFDQRVPRWSTFGVHFAAAVVALICGAMTLAFHSITPSVYLIALALVSVGDAFFSWKVRARKVVLSISE